MIKTHTQELLINWPKFWMVIDGNEVDISGAQNGVAWHFWHVVGNLIYAAFGRASGADLGGGVQGVATPPNSQSHSIKCSTTNVLRYAQALIYIAKSLVVVVVSSK